MTGGLIEIPGYLSGTWTIDPAHFDVSFVIRHLMISNIKGHFTKFDGQIVTAQDPDARRRRIARGEGPDHPGDRGRPAARELAPPLRGEPPGGHAGPVKQGRKPQPGRL